MRPIPAPQTATTANGNGARPSQLWPRSPTRGVGLCLSGGGYRAMLFHVGVLWRLNEAGWLRRIDEISSVSGGSITAGVLGLAWPELSFNRRGVAPDFARLVAAPLRALAARRVDIRAIATGIAIPGRSTGDSVAAAYRRRLFGRATLQDLPDRPRFVFNATNLSSGALARFSKRYVADWRVGRIEKPPIELAAVVACSSAFPPLLGPYRLSLEGREWLSEPGNDLTGAEYRNQWLLSDGGVYDNLGVETAWKRCRTLILSDAGGRINPQARPARDWGRHLVRTIGVVENQVRSLRVRQAITAFQSGERLGFYAGIRSEISRYTVPDTLPADHEQTTLLAQIPTRLAPLRPTVQEQLINWGYAICDAGLRARLDRALASPPAFPYPESAIG